MEKRRQLLTGAALFVVAPTVTFVVALAASWRSPVPFVASVALHLLALGWLVRVAISWLRPQRSSGAGDFAVALVPLVTGTVSLVLAAEIAKGYGIKGSAWPRVRHSIKPFAADYAYLGANLVIIVMMATAVALLALLVRSQPWAGALWNKAEETAGDAVEAAFGIPDEPRIAAPVTSAADPFWRRLMSPSAWVLFAICAALSLPGMWLVAADYKGELGWLVGGLILYVGAPVTAWAVLQSVWRPDDELGVLLPAVYRSVAVPFVTALPIGLLQLAFATLPVFADRVRSFQHPEVEYHGHFWFPLEDVSLLRLFAVQVGMAEVFFAMLAGLVVTVFLVLPILAFRDPDQFMRDQMLSTRKTDRRQNVLVVRALAVGLPLAFIVPTIMLGSSPGDGRWWIGIALAAVGVGATGFIWRTQRVDVEARAASGAPLGILNPDDRKRLRHGDEAPD